MPGDALACGRMSDDHGRACHLVYSPWIGVPDRVKLGVLPFLLAQNLLTRLEGDCRSWLCAVMLVCRLALVGAERMLFVGRDGRIWC